MGLDRFAGEPAGFEHDSHVSSSPLALVPNARVGQVVALVNGARATPRYDACTREIMDSSDKPSIRDWMSRPWRPPGKPQPVVR